MTMMIDSAARFRNTDPACPWSGAIHTRLRVGSARPYAARPGRRPARKSRNLAAGQSESAAIALSALYHFLDEPSVDMLRRVLGLTPSGTVRLVDRLGEPGYVARRPGHDGRSVSLTLTAAGRRAGARVGESRGEVLEAALAVLSPAQRNAFEQALSRVLPGLMRGPGAVRQRPEEHGQIHLLGR